MNEDILIRHALMNAWCTPRQDLHQVFKPARITRPSGVRGIYTWAWHTLELPDSTHIYHLFQIGQVEPSMLGLTSGRQVWRKISSIMVNDYLIADVYNKEGRMLNRDMCFVQYTEERNLVLAIRNQDKIFNVREEEIYVRLYSNSFFDSSRAYPDPHEIEYKTYTVADTPGLTSFIALYNVAKTRIGGIKLFHNGVYVDRIYLPDVKTNDILEYVRDSSIKQEIDLNVKDLRTFHSQKDNKLKYLLHYPETQVNGPLIDYHDDIDIYITRPRDNDPLLGFDGCYYHRNASDSVRQVTHRNYSIPSAYLEDYVNQRDHWLHSDELTLKLSIRYSGWERPLIFEHNRIQELYKLPHDAIRQAMVGTGSNVSVWKASELENSDYTKIMGLLENDIDRTLVEDAYGYNAVATLVGNSPIRVESVNGRRQVSLPYGQWHNTTMFEYDVNGKLIGTYYHAVGPEYTPHSPDCELVEGVVGRGAYKIKSWFGHSAVLVDPIYNYRYYVTTYKNGDPDPDNWQDITGDVTKYQIVNNQVIWLVDPDIHYPAMRSDEMFLLYELEINAHNSLIRFSIDNDVTHPSSAAHGVFGIPFGNLDLWINGHCLIENLDFFVEWPQIVICNKKFTYNIQKHKVLIRASGFCESDMKLPKPAESGYVQHGLLSRNNRFNLRDDKVIRLVIGGSLYHRDIMEFAEDHAGVAVSTIPEGTPYVIENIVTPMPYVTTRDDYSYLSTAKAIDQEIEDYLTLKLPQPPIPQPVIIPDKYELYSPFASVILFDMIRGAITMDGFMGQFSDHTLKQRLKEYEYLLPYDPCFQNLDLRYVNVHPHNQYYVVDVNIYQHRFLARAVRIYLNDRVDLAQFIAIQPM